MTLGIGVSQHGPMFDGRADAAAVEMCKDAERAIAIRGSAMVRAKQGATFKAPTPYYMPHTQARKTTDGWRITGPSVAYGHWLEGTGSRNRTTRFKGYFIFRTMAKVIQQASAATVAPIIARYVNTRMGGR